MYSARRSISIGEEAWFRWWQMRREAPAGGGHGLDEFGFGEAGGGRGGFGPGRS